VIPFDLPDRLSGSLAFFFFPLCFLVVLILPVFRRSFFSRNFPDQTFSSSFYSPPFFWHMVFVLSSPIPSYTQPFRPWRAPRATFVAYIFVSPSTPLRRGQGLTSRSDVYARRVPRAVVLVARWLIRPTELLGGDLPRWRLAYQQVHHDVSTPSRRRCWAGAWEVDPELLRHHFSIQPSRNAAAPGLRCTLRSRPA
jgi:hypothetical protein